MNRAHDGDSHVSLPAGASGATPVGASGIARIGAWGTVAPGTVAFGTVVPRTAVAPGMEIQQVRTLVDALALSWSPKVFDDPLDAARLEICEDDTAGTMPPWSRLAASR